MHFRSGWTKYWSPEDKDVYLRSVRKKVTEKLVSTVNSDDGIHKAIWWVLQLQIRPIPAMPSTEYDMVLEHLGITSRRSLPAAQSSLAIRSTCPRDRVRGPARDQLRVYAGALCCGAGGAMWTAAPSSQPQTSLAPTPSISWLLTDSCSRTLSHSADPCTFFILFPILSLYALPNRHNIS